MDELGGSMKACEKCGMENREGSVFCSNCGSELSGKVKKIEEVKPQIEKPIQGNWKSIYELNGALVIDARFTILIAFFGGVIAAIIGGGIWAAIEIKTGYEYGILAWGISWVISFVILLSSRNRRGIPLQIIGVLISIFGIFIGKFICYSYLVLEGISKESWGLEFFRVVSKWTQFSFLLQEFIKSHAFFLSLFDIVWYGLAIITPWRILKAKKISANLSGRIIPSCPKCKSKFVLPIVYDYTESIMKEAKEGKLIIAEYKKDGENPQWHCSMCRNEWSDQGYYENLKNSTEPL